METKRVIILTGASSGIGLALAERAARGGFNVVAVGRRAERLERLQYDVEGAIGRVLTIALDITEHGAPERIVEATLERFGRVDILVNNAGGVAAGAISDQRDVALREQVDTHVVAPLALLRESLPSLKERRGHVFFVGSGVARVPVGALGAYPPAKAAVRSLTRIVRNDLRPHGIAVTYIDPGAVATEFMTRAGFEGPPALLAASPYTVARRIYAAFSSRPDVVNGVPWQTTLVAIGEALPSVTDWLLSLAPGIVGGNGDVAPPLPSLDEDFVAPIASLPAPIPPPVAESIEPVASDGRQNPVRAAAPDVLRAAPPDAAHAEIGAERVETAASADPFVDQSRIEQELASERAISGSAAPGQSRLRFTPLLPDRSPAEPEPSASAIPEPSRVDTPDKAPREPARAPEAVDEESGAPESPASALSDAPAEATVASHDLSDATFSHASAPQSPTATAPSPESPVLDDAIHHDSTAHDAAPHDAAPVHDPTPQGTTTRDSAPPGDPSPRVFANEPSSHEPSSHEPFPHDAEPPTSGGIPAFPETPWPEPVGPPPEPAKPVVYFEPEPVAASFGEPVISIDEPDGDLPAFAKPPTLSREPVAAEAEHRGKGLVYVEPDPPPRPSFAARIGRIFGFRENAAKTDAQPELTPIDESKYVSSTPPAAEGEPPSAGLTEIAPQAAQTQVAEAYEPTAQNTVTPDAELHAHEPHATDADVVPVDSDSIASESSAAAPIASASTATDFNSREPESATPIAAPSIGVGPFVIEPMVAEPIVARPIVAEPTAAEPAVAASPVAERIVPKPQSPEPSHATDAVRPHHETAPIPEASTAALGAAAVVLPAVFLPAVATDLASNSPSAPAASSTPVPADGTPHETASHAPRTEHPANEGAATNEDAAGNGAADASDFDESRDGSGDAGASDVWRRPAASPDTGPIPWSSRATPWLPPAVEHAGAAMNATDAVNASESEDPASEPIWTQPVIPDYGDLTPAIEIDEPAPDEMPLPPEPLPFLPEILIEPVSADEAAGSDGVDDHDDYITETLPEESTRYERALAGVARRMKKLDLSHHFLARLLVPGDVLFTGDVALRWAGMPNKNERLLTAEALQALTDAGYLERLEDERYRVLKSARD